MHVYSLKSYKRMSNLYSMATDIFRDDDSLDILIGSMLNGHDRVNLRDINIETYIVPDSYTVQDCVFNSEDAVYKQVRRFTEPIIEIAERAGCNANLFTALYEAMLNAYQHGNQLDETKPVQVAYKIGDNNAEIGVIDQGGLISPAFIPFIKRHRLGMHKERFLDWYSFTNQDKPKTNNGTGTSFMHTYVDNVQYFKSADGGLVCHLTKHW